MPPRSNDTPLPYCPGKHLQLQVLWGRRSLHFSQSVTAIISKPISITMSPVMDVTISTESCSPLQAILKLYDRRFGRDFREIEGNHTPHSSADEESFQSFVRRGKMAPFLHKLEEDRKAAVTTPRASRYHDGTPEGSARFEAALWQECNELFECETEAYARLSDLQGSSVPHLYAHVCLVLSTSDVPKDLQQPQLACYFEVKGVLLEYIPGYNLRDLATSPLAPRDPSMWPGIVQSAVDVTHVINQRGVIMVDCGPRNVVVNKYSQIPFIVDLAQCRFKDKMIEIWENTEDSGEDDAGEDWDPDVKYWYAAIARDNPVAIGAIMTQVLREKGITLDIKYPDIDKLINDIKSRIGIKHRM